MKPLLGLIAALIIVLGLCVPFLAQAQNHEKVQTAVSNAPRHAQCFKKLRKKPDWTVCEELIPDLLDKHALGELVSGFVSCVPATTTPQEVRETFDAWISKRPHFSKYTAWDTLSGGLSVLYRCPK